jgi:hypothetical protein
LGLQLFIVGLHTNISLEVIKSNTADIYEAFMISHAYETAVKSKKESDITVKINKMDAEFEDKEQAKIRQNINKRKCFALTMDLLINRSPTGAMAPATATAATATTPIVHINNPDLHPALHANQI